MFNKKDPVQKYNFFFLKKKLKDSNAITCKFCEKTSKGGVFLAKQHQIRTYKNVVACKNCPPEVKEELKAYIEARKTQKVASYGHPSKFDEVKALGDDGAHEICSTSLGKRVNEESG